MYKRLIFGGVFFTAAAVIVCVWWHGTQPFSAGGDTDGAVRHFVSAPASDSGTRDSTSAAPKKKSSGPVPQDRSRVAPEVRRYLEELDRKQEESNAKYKDQIDTIKAMAEGPERESLVRALRDECLNHDICGEDGVYLSLEMYKAEMAHGKFNFLYIGMALTQYSSCVGDYDAQIQLLNDVIKTLEQRDFEVGFYATLRLKTDKDIAAAIGDIRKRIAEIEEIKRRSEAFAETGRYPANRESSKESEKEAPGGIVLLPGLSAEQKAVHEDAKEALLSDQSSKAMELWESIGDKENAAAALMVSGGPDIEASLHAADEVVRKYPGTRQAALAGYRKAMLHKRAGRTPEFTKEMEKFVAEHPDSDCAGLGLAELALQAQDDNRPTDAIRFCEQCDQWYREHKSSVNMKVVSFLADLYTTQGDWEKADKLLSESIHALKEEKLTLAEAEDELETATAVQRLERFHANIKMRAGHEQK